MLNLFPGPDATRRIPSRQWLRMSAATGIGLSLQQLLQAEAVTPDDFAATILHAFGLAPETTVEDPTGRPVQISTGTPVTALS